MRKSAEAFYEMAGSLLPEAMSSDLDAFYNALLHKKEHLLTTIRENTQVTAKETHNDFSPYTLGRTLAALTDIAHSDRIDISAKPNQGQ